jgi:hypothetical protein
VFIIPIVIALDSVILSVQHDIGLASNQTEVTAVPSVLVGQCGMLILAKTGMLG